MQRILLVLAMTTVACAVFADNIVFTRQVNNNDNLVLLEAGKAPRVITNHRRKDSSPIVSRDGRYLAFASERVGWWKIWVMDLRSAAVTQLTDSTAAEYSPAWSPSGEELVFVSSRDGNSELYIVHRDGSGLRNVTNNSKTDTLPQWHVDGRIYYNTEIDDVLQIASIRPDGSDRMLHTHGQYDRIMPQLSPDGSRFLYYSDRHGNTDVYALMVAGDIEQRLTDSPLLDIRARWSPDGSSIVYENGNKADQQHIFSMEADGSRRQQLTSRAYNYAASFVADCSLLCAQATGGQ